MNHERDDQLFEKYMDGELDPRDALEFEEHVKSCPECAGRYAGFMKIKRGLSSVGDEPLPVGFINDWKKKIYSYGSRPKKKAKLLGRYFPALAAGVAVVAVVSAVALSGVLSPAASLNESINESMIAGSAESQAADERAMQDYAAKGAENGEAASDSENASLFMTQQAPEASAAPEMSAEVPAAADKMAIPLYVTKETFDALTKLLVDNGTDFCLDENYMVLPITEDNQNYITEFAEEYFLGITPLPGETYDIQTEG